MFDPTENAANLRKNFSANLEKFCHSFNTYHQLHSVITFTAVHGNLQKHIFDFSSIAEFVS